MVDLCTQYQTLVWVLPWKLWILDTRWRDREGALPSKLWRCDPRFRVWEGSHSGVWKYYDRYRICGGHPCKHVHATPTISSEMGGHPGDPRSEIKVQYVGICFTLETVDRWPQVVHLGGRSSWRFWTCDPRNRVWEWITLETVGFWPSYRVLKR